MNAIEFGTLIKADRIEEVTQLEELGFDSLWASEHVFFHGPNDDALTVLAAAAMRTSVVRLGTAVLLLPLRPAAATAKAATTVDRLSNGRLILGIGVGGEYPKEFQACGVPVEERGRRTDEAIALLRRLWTEETVDFYGRFNRLEGVRLQPGPIQTGGPPIWIAGRSEAAVRRAARLGDGYLPYLFDVARYARSVDQLRELATAAGRDPAAITTGLYLFTYLAPTLDEARAVAAAKLGKQYNQPFDKLVDRYCALGTGEQVRERIGEFVEAGVGHFILVPACELEEVPEQYHRFASEIFPHFRARGNGRVRGRTDGGAG